MQLIFWGTRGSLPMNTPQHRIYGGNTSCVSVHGGDKAVIFDAGSGLVHLGTKWVTEARHEIDICFSHFHADHICGLPFFKPFFDPRFHIRLHSFGENETTLEHAVRSYLSQPYFPITIDDFVADVSFIHHEAGAAARIGGLDIKTLAIPHPGGAHALKATHAGKNFVYATDTEHEPDAPNDALIDFMRDADMAVYDCTFDDSEFDARRGWGHSTWQEGVRLAKAAKVKRFGIFHHEPERSDAALAQIERRAQEDFAATLVTRDFLELDL